MIHVVINEVIFIHWAFLCKDQLCGACVYLAKVILYHSISKRSDLNPHNDLLTLDP